MEKSKKIYFWVGGYIGKFLSFSTFSNCFTLKWLQMIHNGEFCQKSGLHWLKMANFGHLTCFSIFSPQNEAQIDLEWPISPDSQLFPSFATKASHFWRNLKNFHGLGGTLANFLSFSTFSICFTLK